MSQAALLSEWLDGPPTMDRLREVIHTVPAVLRKAAWESGKWIAQMADPLPAAMRRAMLTEYGRTLKGAGAYAANQLLLDVAERTKGPALRLAAGDDELCDYAEARARGMRQLRAGRDPALALAPMIEALDRLGWAPPFGWEEMGPAGVVARLEDPRWWRRQVRHRQGRAVEGAARHLMMVHKRRAPYASDDTVTRRRQQRRRNRAMLLECLAVNELGQQYTLAELADLSTANPIIKRSELMTRISGFEDVAKSAGDVGEFVTLTCPSRMHRAHRHGAPIDNYDGTDPRQAQQYLVGVWARIRAALGRAEIRPYGVRVAEPHHDGTPHWHMLLFLPSDRLREFRAIVRDHALRADGDEKGARQYRVKFKAIDPAQGTAAGYVAKYVAKNIDAYALATAEDDGDLLGIDPIEAADRVDAWASTWGIRQFQFVGGPPVTVWRELRRIETAPPGVIEDARTAADAGNWRRFVDVMGGPQVGRGCHPLKVARAIGKPGRYGEPVERVIGVEAGAVMVPTRLHEWTIERRSGRGNGLLLGGGEQEGRGRSGRADRGVDQRMGGRVLCRGRGPGDFVRCDGAVGEVGAAGSGVVSLSGATAPPWTRVNNCTEGGSDGGEEGGGSPKDMGGKTPDHGSGGGHSGHVSGDPSSQTGDQRSRQGRPGSPEGARADGG